MDRRNDIGASIDEAVQAIAPALIEIRRDIHAHPEIGFEVQRTAGVVAAELDRLGIPYKTGIGRTGIVAEIEGGAPGPRLLIRADMDALPSRRRPACLSPARFPAGCMPAATTSTPRR